MLYLDQMLGRTFCSLDNYTRWWKTKTVDQVKEALGCG